MIFKEKKGGGKMSNLDFAYLLIGFIIGIIPAIISKVMKNEWLGLIAASSCTLMAIIFKATGIVLALIAAVSFIVIIVKSVKKCPHCHERIKAKATTCRYCSREIT
jgi:hypothetical protein